MSFKISVIESSNIVKFFWFIFCICQSAQADRPLSCFSKFLGVIRLQFYEALKRKYWIGLDYDFDYVLSSSVSILWVCVLTLFAVGLKIYVNWGGWVFTPPLLNTQNHCEKTIFFAFQVI